MSHSAVSAARLLSSSRMFAGRNTIVNSSKLLVPLSGTQISRRQQFSTTGKMEQSKSLEGGIAFLAKLRHGQPRLGVENGPLYLSKGFSFPPTVKTVDAIPSGIQWPENDEFRVSTNPNPNVRIRNRTAVGHSNLDISSSIVLESTAYIKRSGSFPSILTLGGDHSLSIGSIKGVAHVCERALSLTTNLPFKSDELVVIWVDAHGDINTPSTTSSGNLHGCPVSRLVGLDPQGWSELGYFDWVGSSGSLPLKTKNLAYIALRALDDPEVDIIKDHNIISYPMDAVNAYGRDVRKIVRECVARADPEGIRPILLSFDIDAIDPRYAPSTGTPADNGLYPPEAIAIVEELKRTGRLVAMDLVEVNPSLGYSPGDAELTVNMGRDLMTAFYMGKSS